MKWMQGEYFNDNVIQWYEDENRRYSDVMMSSMASQITSFTIVYSTIYSGADQRKHQSSASLAFVRGIHRWPVNSPQKVPLTFKNAIYIFGHFVSASML